MINGTSKKLAEEEYRVYKNKELRVGDVWKMHSKGLINIIEETPLAFRNRVIGVTEKGYMDILKGLVLRLPYKLHKNMSEYGILINLDCDNYGETLVHEACHIKYPHCDEDKIEELTEVYWNRYPTVRKAAQRRIVERLGDYKL